MLNSPLARKLIAGLVAISAVPTLTVGVVLFAHLQHGFYRDNPSAALIIAAIANLVIVSWLAGLGIFFIHSLVRELHSIRLGTELIGTVNPDHRLEVSTGDDLESLADDINRMADRLREARSELDNQVTRATKELDLERGKLSTVLEALGQAVVLATVDGRVSLANQAAQQLLGSSVLGRNLFDLVDREKVGHFVERLQASGSAFEHFSLHLANGVILETVLTPFFDLEKRMIGFILVLRDVTVTAESDQQRQQLLTNRLQELRNALASVRSLSESLVGQGGTAQEASRPLLEAIHAGALRVSSILGEMDDPSALRQPGSEWHFEEISIPDLTAMTLRRSKLDREAVDLGETDPLVDSPPVLRVEISSMSATLAYLLEAMDDRRESTGRPWLQPKLRGRVVQIDIGSVGSVELPELEPLLDLPVVTGVGGRLSVREIAGQHSGEVWAYSEGARKGFRLMLRIDAPTLDETGDYAEPRDVLRGSVPPDPSLSLSFAGAGLMSGFNGDEAQPERPEFYDFSLFDQMDRGLKAADRHRSLDELAYVVFDTETTGLQPEAGDRILSIAGVKVRGGMVKRAETFDALVNPQRSIPARSIKFHGITSAMVAEAPPIEVVLPAFLRYAEDAVVVGHEVSFDLRFIGIEMERLGLPALTLSNPVLDTLLLSELVHGPLVGHGLDGIAARLGVVVRGRHSALGDALTTAEILVRLLGLLKRRGIWTLGEAMDAAMSIGRGKLSKLATQLGE